MRNLTDRELATVLAALRISQNHPAGWMSDHFSEVKPLTNDDIDALCEELNTTGLKPAVIVGGEPSTKLRGRVTPRRLACPHCGKTTLNSYYEDISNRRSVNNKLTRIGDTLTLDIDNFYETDGGDEDGDNPRLGCSNCGNYCSIPESVTVDFS
jgi:ribosomal protein S27AE